MPKFEATTTSQTVRTYVVEAADAAEARAIMHEYVESPEDDDARVFFIDVDEPLGEEFTGGVTPLEGSRGRTGR